MAHLETETQAFCWKKQWLLTTGPENHDVKIRGQKRGIQYDQVINYPLALKPVLSMIPI